MRREQKFIKYITLYLLATLAYYFLGRYQWIIPSPTKLILYVLLCVVALYFGFLICIRYSSSKQIINVSYNFKTRSIVLFRLSCFTVIIFQIMWVVVMLGRFSIWDLTRVIGTNYFERLFFVTDSPVFIMQLRTLLWGLTLFAYPIGFVFYKRFGWFDKTLLAITILVDVLSAVNMGVSKNIGDILLIFIACQLVKQESPKDAILKRKKTFQIRINKPILWIILFVIMFNIIQYARDEVIFSDRSMPSNLFPRFAEVRETTVFDLLTLRIPFVINNIERLGVYASHGYTGLAFALDLPFQSTYWFGFSRALLEYVEEFTGQTLRQETYNARIESLFGWHNGMYWPTAYVWLGNILSLWFVPVLILIFGAILAIVFKRFEQRKDIPSLALLCQLFIGAIYLPANAQLVQSRASLWGIIMLVVVYVVTNRSSVKTRKCNESLHISSHTSIQQRRRIKSGF